MYHAAALMGEDPAATLLSQLLKTIFHLHMLLAEVAAGILEVAGVQGHQLTEHIVFNLTDEVAECVAVHETAFACRMGMQVEVEHQSVLATVVLHKRLQGKYRGSKSTAVLLLSGCAVIVVSV